MIFSKTTPDFYLLSNTSKFQEFQRELDKKIQENVQLVHSVTELIDCLSKVKKKQVQVIFDVTDESNSIIDEWISRIHGFIEIIDLSVALVSDENGKQSKTFFQKNVLSDSPIFNLFFNADSITNQNNFESFLSKLPYEKIPDDTEFPNYIRGNFPISTQPEPMIVEEPETSSAESHHSPSIVSQPFFGEPIESEMKVVDGQKSPIPVPMLTMEDIKELEELQEYEKKAAPYIESLEADNDDLKIENKDLRTKIKSLEKKLNNNSVYDKNLEESEADNLKLKNELEIMEKRALKAEKVANLNSPEASIIELFTAMNNLSNKLSTSSKLIENKAEKELKDKQKEIDRLKTRTNENEKIKETLRKLIGS